MSIYISSAIVLGDITPSLPANNPKVGYHNLVTVGNLTATSSQSDYPISNASNPSTREIWKSNSLSVQYVTVTVTAEADYVGIARHNLASAGVSVMLQSTDDGSVWDDVAEFIPADDDPFIILFDKEVKEGYRLKLTPDEEYPTIGVIYLGEILTLQRRIYIGHTPITYGRVSTVSNGRSETGEYLGRITRNTYREATIQQQNVDPDFYRESMEPWIESAISEPFFFAWRPEDYPDEVGYVWATGDAQMSNQRGNGMIQFSLSVQGVA